VNFVSTKAATNPERTPRSTGFNRIEQDERKDVPHVGSERDPDPDLPRLAVAE